MNNDNYNVMKDGSIASNGIGSKRNRRQHSFDASPLESLTADISSYLLSYLRPHDLFNVGKESSRHDGTVCLILLFGLLDFNGEMGRADREGVLSGVDGLCEEALFLALVC